MSVYISPNLTKKKTDYKPSDKITIYLNYYFQGKKLRIPSEVTVLFKDWDKNWKQGRKSDPILLDPFMGSGTVGRVCDKLGRSFVGYDLKGC